MAAVDGVDGCLKVSRDNASSATLTIALTSTSTAVKFDMVEEHDDDDKGDDIPLLLLDVR